MVDRDEIEEEVRDGLEVIETGNWFIAEGSYDGLESARQGESRQEAINNLVRRFYEDARREEKREEERERMREYMESRKELADERAERARERAEAEFEQVQRRLEERSDE